MTTVPVESLEDLLVRAGEGWILEKLNSPERTRRLITGVLEKVSERASQIAPGSGLEFSEETLIREYRRSPHKVRAFIQALAEANSPDMLVMVWRVLQGMEVERVEMQYVLADKFALRVTLRSPGGGGNEIYTSSNINDATLIRHFGILKMDEKPVFSGYYARPR